MQNAGVMKKVATDDQENAKGSPGGIAESLV
jgi:hypothetical protein